MHDDSCPACTFSRATGSLCARHALARDRRLDQFLATGVISLPERRYRVQLTYDKADGEEFMTWSDESGWVHDPSAPVITTRTTFVEFAGEEPFSIFADGEGARVDVSSAEYSAQRELEWIFERGSEGMFSLISSPMPPTKIPTRDPKCWGVEYRGWGLWGASSIGRCLYVLVHDAVFLEHDLMDIIGITGRNEWNTGLGRLAEETSYWGSSIARGHLVPLKLPGDETAQLDFGKLFEGEEGNR